MSLKEKLVSYGFCREHGVRALLPNDIILLIASWFRITDRWHRQRSFDQLYISSDKETHCECVERTQQNATKVTAHAAIHGFWWHAFGTDIVQRGEVKSWRLKVLNSKQEKPMLLIGIVDINQTLKQRTPLTHHFGRHGYMGYAILTINGRMFQDNGSPKELTMNDGVFHKGKEFALELDMSHNKNKTTGVLRIYDEQNQPIVASGNVDMEKQYSLCVAFWFHGEKIATLCAEQ